MGRKVKEKKYKNKRFYHSKWKKNDDDEKMIKLPSCCMSLISWISLYFELGNMDEMKKNGRI